jgi:hypothetical protein
VFVDKPVILAYEETACPVIGVVAALTSVKLLKSDAVLYWNLTVVE